MTAIPASDEWVVSLPVGAVVATEFCFYMKNRNYRHDGTVMGFVYCSAYSAGAPYMVGAGFCRELARRGYPVICGDVGDTPTGLLKTDGPGVWGKDASLAKLATYKTFLQTQLGAKAGKIGVLYGSHGCSTAYAYAAAHPTEVQLIAGGIGTCDVEDIRANNRNGYQASIETAYTNDAGWQAARATHNPVQVADELAAIPQLDYYSTDDPICTAATHAALATAAGANLTQRSMGALGHGWTLTPRDHADTRAFADWVVANAA